MISFFFEIPLEIYSIFTLIKEEGMKGECWMKKNNLRSESTTHHFCKTSFIGFVILLWTVFGMIFAVLMVW